MSEEYEVPNFLKDISKADTQNMVQTHLDVESTRSSVYHKFKEKATKEESDKILEELNMLCLITHLHLVQTKLLTNWHSMWFPKMIEFSKKTEDSESKKFLLGMIRDFNRSVKHLTSESYIKNIFKTLEWNSFYDIKDKKTTNPT